MGRISPPEICSIPFRNRLPLFSPIPFYFTCSVSTKGQAGTSVTLYPLHVKPYTSLAPGSSVFVAQYDVCGLTLPSVELIPRMTSMQMQHEQYVEIHRSPSWHCDKPRASKDNILYMYLTKVWTSCKLIESLSNRWWILFQGSSSIFFKSVFFPHIQF